MTTNEIRKKFLTFFASQNHTIVPGDSVVPKDDPTVLFTTAGMQQFKPNFLGIDKSLKRAASCQKCLRTDDLERVGKTPVHHTFFEMLGNFSFGDYFKKEAIEWAWEFFTKELKIPADRLWASVYKDDPEAYDAWLNQIKLPANRILKLGDKDNFWPANAREDGPNGPCGPCSEIFYDFGVNKDCSKGDQCNPECNCGRFAEIWNLVFTQFNRKDGGVLEPLPNKNIDTGMGLERLAAVMQGKKTNFENDIFVNIIEVIKKKIHGCSDVHARIIADHTRAIVFAIADGVIPSNESRGYVVKKLIVEAADLALGYGMEQPVIHCLVPVVVSVMGDPYPEIIKESDRIATIIHKTEEAFIAVRKTRIPELEKLFQTVHGAGQVRHKAIGELIFRYRDTHGLTLSTIYKASKRAGIHDFVWEPALKCYDELMAQQKERSRAGSKMTGDVFTGGDLDLNSVPKTKFLGYDQMDSKAKVLKIFVDNKEVQSAQKGDAVKIILDQTPFYAESGGQIGDAGAITTLQGTVRVNDTQKVSDIYIHSCTIEQGTLKAGEAVEAKIDSQRRQAIMRNHTATHLLQSALREVLGAHIKQQGSLVDENRLRFDFAHPKGVAAQEVERIEKIVNDRVQAREKVEKEVLPIEEAKKRGALAFFAEKYGDVVRVVSIDGYSKEFCGGTHLNNTGEIEQFKIISEGAVAQGIRRIEAITGQRVNEYKKEKEQELSNRLKEILKKNSHLEKELGREPLVEVPGTDLNIQLEKALAKTKQLEKELESVRFDRIKQSLENIIKESEIKNDVHLIAYAFDHVDMNTLRKISDYIKQKVKSAVMVLGASNEFDASVLVVVTDNLVNRNIKANELIQPIVQFIGGSGGGRPQMAQAGSKHPEKIKEAIRKSKELIKEKI